MAKESPVVLAGLDPGTSKTAVIIAMVNKGSLELVGTGESPSLGVHKGVISNPALTAKSVKQALEKAEKMAGIKVGKAVVSYCGANIEVISCPDSLPLTRSTGSGPKAGRTAVRGFDPALAVAPPGKRIIQRLPAPSTRTGSEPKQPGNRAVTAPSEDIANLIECVRLAGPAVQEVVYGPLAGAHALLTQAEKELGTALIDIGAGTTSVSIFNRGSIRETAVLPLGGEHLAGDLAIGLHISLAQAGEILRAYKPKNASGEKADSAGTGFCDAVKGQNPKDLIQSVVEARITEILDLACKVIRGFHYPGLLPGGVVFHGGVSQLSGLAFIAEKMLQMPVRIGRLQNPGQSLNPGYTNALGLIQYRFSRLLGERKVVKTRQEQNDGLVGRVFNWFEDRNKR